MILDQLLRPLKISLGLFRRRLRRRDFRGALFRGGLGRADLRAAQFGVCLQQLQTGLRSLQGRALLLQLHRQVARVNLHQQIPRLHHLIVLTWTCLTWPANFRRDGNNIGVQERIVRRFVRQALGQVAQPAEQQPEEATSQGQSLACAAKPTACRWSRHSLALPRVPASESVPFHHSKR